jgi:hypothetical protein
MRYLNDLEEFVRGEWRDQNVVDVADEDPGYLQRLLNSDHLTFQEAKIIRTALGITEET